MLIAPRALALSAAAVLLLLAPGLPAQTGNIQNLTPSVIPVPKEGGDYTVAVTATGAWAVMLPPSETWVTVTSATSGTGSGALTFHVAANTEAPRVGYVNFNGSSLNVMITQDGVNGGGGGPVQAVSPGMIDVPSVPPGSGNYTIAVTATGAWTAATTESWITIAPPASGDGNGAVSIQVAVNSGAFRTGVVQVGNIGVTVNQRPGGGSFVTRTVPSLLPVSAAGGAYAIAVESTSAWTASTTDSWITIASGASGSGNGSVGIQVAANTGSGRKGAVTVGNLFSGVEQVGADESPPPPPGSIYSFPATVTLPPEGGAATVQIKATGDWTAVPADSHVVMAQQSGHGDGTVSFLALPNWIPGPRDSMALSVNGVTMTHVLQDALGPVTLDPTHFDVSHTAGAGTINVTASGPWVATADPPLQIVSGASGTGNGVLSWTIPNDPDAYGKGYLLRVNSAQAQVVMVAPKCGWRVIPFPFQWIAPPGGGTFTEQVVEVDCPAPWTAQPDADWVKVSPSSGVGTAAVTLGVQPNSGATRTANVAIADKTISVQQPADCPVSVSPSSLNPGPGGASGDVAITAPAGCDWMAVGDAPWITFTGAVTGTGPGTAHYVIGENASSKGRGSAIHVSRNSIWVDQAGTACAFNISAPSGLLPSGATSAQVTLTVPDASCGWGASTAQTWAKLSQTHGSGNAVINLDVAPNPGPDPRTLALTIAYQGVTLTQAGGVCHYGLSPGSVDLAADARSGTLQVGTAPSCSWTASTADTWITLGANTSAAGAGTVSYSTAANLSAMARAGAISVSGVPFSIEQTGATCQYKLPSDAGLNFDSIGGDIPVEVTALQSGCPAPQIRTSAAWLTATVGWVRDSGLMVVTAGQKTDAGTRSAQVTVNGALLNAAQNGSSGAAAYTATPSYVYDDGSGGKYAVSIAAAGGGASAPAVSLLPGSDGVIPSWVHLGSLAGAAGGWSVDVVLDAFPGQAGMVDWRQAALNAGGRAVYVKQQSK